MQRYDSEMLSNMLSSRSYLELSDEQPQEEQEEKAPASGRNKKNYIQPIGQPSPEVKDEPERHLRPRKKPTTPIAPEIPEQAENTDSAAPDRPGRKRGRPRRETVKDAAAIEVDPAGPPMIVPRKHTKLHRNAGSRSGGHNAPTG
jgi:hypothetical protein